VVAVAEVITVLVLVLVVLELIKQVKHLVEVHLQKLRLLVKLQ
jgi:hypothetical protein